VCGWLFGDFETAELARHLGAMSVQPRKSDQAGVPKRSLLRFWDPSVLPSIWRLLEPRQREVLIDGLQSWHLIDRDGQLQSLQFVQNTDQADNTSEPRHQLALSANQWLAIQNIGALNAALLELPADSPIPGAEVREAIMASLMRARAIGIHDTQDLNTFAKHALKIHPAFDTHPLLQKTLRNFGEKKFYRTAVSALTKQEWQTVHQDCLQISGTSN